MNIQQLYTKVAQGFSWNALLYMLHKSAGTIVIMLLYTILPTNMFSIYGNINSITFLLLLWLDFGFHKAVPLFVIKYAQDSNSLNLFIKRILLFKVILLLISVPIYLVLIDKVLNTLQLSSFPLLAYIGASLFITEGILSIVRLIYHAYFLHSIYNKISAVTLLLELGISLLAILFLQAYMLLLAIFGSKIVANCVLLAITWYKKDSIYQQHITDQVEHKRQQTDIDRQFVIHATVMYMSTTIKSLSERNFLLPIFTVAFGPVIANMFKVANDGALFFYRIIIKTIGTLDTSLFSYTQSTHQHNKTWQIAIRTLTHKIGALVIPFLGIAYIIYSNKHVINHDLIIFDLFLIIVVELLTEVLFSPFERILEVKKEYTLLAYAYTPYIMVMLILLFTQTMTYIGIVNTLLLIHGVRLVSTFIMTYLVYIKYAYTLPVYFIGLLISLTLPCVYILQRIIEELILVYS